MHTTHARPAAKTLAVRIRSFFSGIQSLVIFSPKRCAEVLFYFYFFCCCYFDSSVNHQPSRRTQRNTIIWKQFSMVFSSLSLSVCLHWFFSFVPRLRCMHSFSARMFRKNDFCRRFFFFVCSRVCCVCCMCQSQNSRLNYKNEWIHGWRIVHKHFSSAAISALAACSVQIQSMQQQKKPRSESDDAAENDFFFVRSRCECNFCISENVRGQMRSRYLVEMVERWAS